MFLAVFDDFGGPVASRMPLGASLEEGLKKFTPSAVFWVSFGEAILVNFRYFGGCKIVKFLACPQALPGMSQKGHLGA